VKEQEKGPSLEGWRKIGEVKGLTGGTYGVYRSPDDRYDAHRDEDDGETTLIMERGTYIITYVHPNTAIGAKRLGFDLRVGMKFKEVVDSWLLAAHGKERM